MSMPKTPKLFKCIDCLYVWYSKSSLEKPTCPKCHGHRTYPVPKRYQPRG